MYSTGLELKNIYQKDALKYIAQNRILVTDMKRNGSDTRKWRTV